MRAKSIALDSRVDGGASISWKLLNTFSYTCLYNCFGWWLPYWVTNRNGIAFRLPFRNVMSFKNAQPSPTHPNQRPLTSSLR